MKTKMTFQEFLEHFLTEAQTVYLRESLRAGRTVHFYGAEGTGKSTVCREFTRNGFSLVTEPGMARFAPHKAGAYTLPKHYENTVLIPFFGIRKRLPHSWKPFSKEDIDEWIKGGEVYEAF